MFESARDQADGLRRIFHPMPPSLIPMACAGALSDCRHYATVVLDRYQRIGSMPALVDRIDDGDAPDDLGRFDRNRRVLLLDQPLRLSLWVAARHPRLLLLLSHRQAALPQQYAVLKAIVQQSGLRRFGSFFVDAADADEAMHAHRLLADSAQRFLQVELLPLTRVAGSLAAMIDASLAGLNDFAIPLQSLPGTAPAQLPQRETMH